MADVNAIIDNARTTAEGIKNNALSATNAITQRVTTQLDITADAGRVIEESLIAVDPFNVSDTTIDGFDKELADPTLSMPDSIEPDNNDFVPDATVFPVDVPAIITSDLFNANPPNLSNLGSFNKSAPNLDIDGIAFSMANLEKPQLSPIDDVQLSNITVPSVPDVNIPSFVHNQQVTALPDEAPEISDSFEGNYKTATVTMQNYINDGVEAWIEKYGCGLKENICILVEKLKAGMESGAGTTDEFEDALYTRARTRAENERERLQVELEQSTAKRGFKLPPSALNAGRHILHEKVASNISEQAVELAIERAKLDIQQKQFVMGLYQANINMLLDASFKQAGLVAETNQRALAYAGKVADIVLAEYEAQLGLANAQIDIIRSEIDLYSIELKSALARYEGHRMELESAKLNVQVDSLKIEQVKVKVDLEDSKIKQYIAMLSAIEKRGALEKLKAEIYGEEVKAYVAGLSKSKLESDIYIAQLNGDESKLKGRLAKIDGYSKQVDAAVAKQRGLEQTARTINELNNFKLKKYVSEIQAFQTEIQTNVATLDAQAKSYDSEIRGTLGKLEIKKQLFRGQLDHRLADMQLKRDDALLKLDDKKVNIDKRIKLMEVASDALETSAKIYADMASSSLSAQSTMVSDITTERA